MAEPSDRDSVDGDLNGEESEAGGGGKESMGGEKRGGESFDRVEASRREGEVKRSENKEGG